MTSTANRSAWLQIAAALDKHPHRDLFDHARSIGLKAAQAGQAQRRTACAAINFGGCVAPQTASVPDGNHGDNFPESAA